MFQRNNKIIDKYRTCKAGIYQCSFRMNAKMIQNLAFHTTGEFCVRYICLQYVYKYNMYLYIFVNYDIRGFLGARVFKKSKNPTYEKNIHKYILFLF